MAIMLILLLDGLWAGIRANITTYEDNVGADLYVAQPGTRNFFGAVSVIPTGRSPSAPTPMSTGRSRCGASSRSWNSTTRKVPTYVIGSVPGRRGGPWELHRGRVPETDDEVAIGSVMAERHGLAVGDRIEIMGPAFTVVGTSTGAFMASFVFMTHGRRPAPQLARDDQLRARRHRPPHRREARLASSGFSVLDRDQLAQADLRLMARAYSVPLTVMRAVAFAIGSLVIALTVYTAIADRRREYGIVKAMGAHGRRLLALAVNQTLIIAASGLVAGGLLFLAGRTYISWVRPQFVILATHRPAWGAPSSPVS